MATENVKISLMSETESTPSSEVMIINSLPSCVPKQLWQHLKLLTSHGRLL